MSLTEAKAHLRVDFDDDDAQISALIAAATAWVDGYAGILGRCLVTQTWVQRFDGFPAGVIALPFADVTAVTVSYVDPDGVAQTVDASDFSLVEERGCPTAVMLADGASWPSTATRPDAVTVTMTAGYGSVDDVPAAIRHAVLLMVGHWYEQRSPVIIGQSVAALPLSADALLAPFRRVGL